MNYLSASSLTNYLRCPRKAILQAHGLRSPATPAMARGTALHAAVESYLRGETPTVEDPLGDLARTEGLLPDPGPDLWVELGLGLPSTDADRYAGTQHWTGQQAYVAGVPFRGIVDLVHIEGGDLVVTDHKTTSGWYWAETDSSLRSNLQVWAYTAQIARWLDWDGPIRCRHIQYLTRGTAAVREVGFRTTRPEAESRWGMIEAIGREFVRDYQQHMVDIRADLTHCSAYGGCPFQAYCSATPNQSQQAAQAVINWRLSI